MIKVVAPALTGLLLASTAALGAQAAPRPARTAFTLQSPSFANGAPLAPANEYNGAAQGCHGGNVAPTLTWSGAPAGTRSFALLMVDPDAKVKGGWVHWFVYNIPATVHTLTAASAPTYTLGMTSFGKAAYGGPCPPLHDKPHHYNFTLIALNIAHVKAPPGSALTRERFILTVGRHWIGRAKLIGTFQRP